MRSFLILFFVGFISLSTCRNSHKPAALTESHGQEIIEIGNPIKELPDLEEEPAAENDVDDSKVTSTTLAAATKKEGKKTNSDQRRRMKDPLRIRPDDEESRIEKELADIYKDNNDYKLDNSAEQTPISSTVSTTTTVTTELPLSDITGDTRKALRGQSEFNFQPNSDSKADIERFRTSIDEIRCNRDYTKLDTTDTTDKPSTKSAVKFFFNLILLIPLSFMTALLR